MVITYPHINATNNITDDEVLSDTFLYIDVTDHCQRKPSEKMFYWDAKLPSKSLPYCVIAMQVWPSLTYGLGFFLLIFLLLGVTIVANLLSLV